MAEERTEKSLSHTAITGLGWNYSAFLIQGLLQLGVTAALARLLSPAEFGVVAVGQVVLRIGALFAQLGIGTAIVQAPTVDRGRLRGAARTSVVVGVIATAACAASAPAIGALFGVPAAGAILAGMSPFFLLTAAGIVPTARLRRALRFSHLAGIETASYVIGYVLVGLPLAAGGAGAWTLVLATLTQAGAASALAVAVTRGLCDQTGVDSGASATDLYRRGAGFTTIGVLELIGPNLDKVILARVAGEGVLGLYTRVLALLELPIHGLVTSMSRVLFPLFARSQGDRVRLSRSFLMATTAITFFCLPLPLGAIPVARPLLLMVLGEAWSSGADLLPLIAVNLPFVYGANLCGIVCDALGMLRQKIAIQAGFVVGVAISLLAAAPHGPLAICAALACCSAVRWGVLMLLVTRRLHIPFGRVLVATGPAAGTALLVAAASAGAVAITGSESPALTVSIAVLLCGIAWTLGALWIPSRDIDAIGHHLLRLVAEQNAGGERIRSEFVRVLAWRVGRGGGYRGSHVGEAPHQAE